MAFRISDSDKETLAVCADANLFEVRKQIGQFMLLGVLGCAFLYITEMTSVPWWKFGIVVLVNLLFLASFKILMGTLFNQRLLELFDDEAAGVMMREQLFMGCVYSTLVPIQLALSIGYLNDKFEIALVGIISIYGFYYAIMKKVSKWFGKDENDDPPEFNWPF